MRVLLSCSDDLSAWIFSDNPSQLRETVTNRLKQCVLFEEQWIKVYEKVGSLPPQKREVLANLLRRAVTTTYSPANAEVRLNPPKTISDLFDDELFQASLIDHTRQGKVGESRVDFFDRTIGHLAKLAKEIHIHDRYAFENLKKGRSGVNWVIWEKVSKLPIKLVIHTTIPERNTNRVELERDVANAISSGIFSSHPEFKLEIFIYALPREDIQETEDPGKHDRFGRIEFSRKNINFDMPKGFEIFKGTNLQEPHKIHSLDSDEFDDKRSAWQKNSKVTSFYSNFSSAG